jgi:hypothetical protein
MFALWFLRSAVTAGGLAATNYGFIKDVSTVIDHCLTGYSFRRGCDFQQGKNIFTVKD